MRSGFIPSMIAAVAVLGLAGCQKPAEKAQAAALDLAAKEFVERPTFANVVTRVDPVGRTVVCGTATGPKMINAPMKPGEPPRQAPLSVKQSVTTRFYVVDNLAVVEFQDTLYAGVDPSVKASADDYQQMTATWFKFGWQSLCEPPAKT